MQAEIKNTHVHTLMKLNIMFIFRIDFVSFYRWKVNTNDG